MALLKASRLLTSTPMDAVEDEGYGYIPNEEDEARDNRIYQVEALAAELVEALSAELGHSETNALPLHAVKSAWESIKPGYAQKTGYAQKRYYKDPLKKAAIKKK